MCRLVINGGKKLFGQIKIPASKNAFLPILAASCMADEEVVLCESPDFSDVRNMISILQNMGVEVCENCNKTLINPRGMRSCKTDAQKSSLIRSSIFLLGSVLGRFKHAEIAKSGGCAIGARPIDIHLNGLSKMGAVIGEKDGYITCDGKNMKGAHVELSFPSVGATENILMASVLTRGVTTITNYAKEPEVIDLVGFLTAMGAKIEVESNRIVVEGVDRLRGCSYKPISDRIIAGTYALACVMCGGKVVLECCNAHHLSALFANISSEACKIDAHDDKIIIDSFAQPKSVERVETSPYPGFATDLQSQFLACMSLADGESEIVENIFENRFNVARELKKMGADIRVCGRVATVKGKKQLFGSKVVAHDLRGGAAVVLAGLAASGQTVVENVHYIDRGYKNIEIDFAKLGADIKRIND